MCSYTVREARTATTPDAFQLGTTTANGLVGLTSCDTSSAAGGAWIVIPNANIASPVYCGSALSPTTTNTVGSPVAGKIICTKKNLVEGTVAPSLSAVGPIWLSCGLEQKTTQTVFIAFFKF